MIIHWKMAAWAGPVPGFNRLRGWLWAIALVAVFQLLAPPPAEAKFDPAHRWRTIQTAHFQIHFHEGEETLARGAGGIAEEVHERLTRRLRWTPSSKTHLVLVDLTDDVTAWAAPFPYNHMVINPRPPVEEGMVAFDTDHWLRLVITHEYTHVLQLDTVHGVPAVLRTLFGRLYFPNGIQPLWLTEGFAVYEETQGTTGGRGRASFTEMLLRTAVHERRFPTMGQLATFPDAWPAGLLPYNFGAKFIQFIAKRVGEEKIAEISHVYGGRTFPFFVKRAGRRALGMEYGTLYREWKSEMGKTYLEQVKVITRQAVTPSRQLTRRGELTLHPTFSPDGKWIAYATANGDEYPNIRLMGVDGQGDRLIVERMGGKGASGGSLAWTPNGKMLYYTKLEQWRSFSTRADIYAYDLAARQERRITRNLRALDPHVSPDGKRLIFATAERENSRIIVLDIGAGHALPAGSGQGRILVASQGNRQFANPRWSPDGKNIAVTVWNPGGMQDIWLLNAVSGAKIAEVTHDRAIDGTPTWSPDGRHVYFSSDRTGVFNIFRYEVSTQEIEQVTNVVTGAFTPSLSPDGKRLTFAVYSADGFDIHTVELAATSPRPAVTYVDRRPKPAPGPPPATGEARPYSPLSTILPRWWFPWYSKDEKGGVLWALTSGQDVLGRHSYFIQAGYGLKSRRLAYDLSYQNDVFYPTLFLRVADGANLYGDLLRDTSGREHDYWERRQRLSAGIFVPFYKIPYQHGFLFAYNRLRMSRLSEPVVGARVPQVGVQAGLRAAWIWNSSKKYRRSISPVDGRRIEIGHEWTDRSLGSDFNIQKTTLDWHEFMRLGRHHTLALRVFGGVASGDRLVQRAYQLGGDFPGDVTLGTENTTLALRGYPPDSVRGQRAALASVEYRFPLWRMDRGPSTAPFYFRRLHGALFVDTGNAWDSGGLKTRDLKTGVGGEIRLDLRVAYEAPVTLRAVLARGVSGGGETQAYVSLWVGY